MQNEFTFIASPVLETRIVKIKLTCSLILPKTGMLGLENLTKLSSANYLICSRTVVLPDSAAPVNDETHRDSSTQKIIF